jgi:hypothetical protein
VADPNHRCKGLTGDLIALDGSKVSLKMTMTRMDSTRIGKNFGYMARTLKSRPEEEYEDAAKAVLEHHFDCHDYCREWCKRRLETGEQRKASKKYYRCKIRDSKLYELLQEKIARFITKDKLIEMAHGLDTNMNEAFNNICTWFAPKNKVFAGAYSLHNRIAFAVGINSLGVLEYFERLYRKLGIPITDNVRHYLQTKEDKRSKRLAKLKTKEAKKHKNKRKHDKLHENTAIAKKELHQRCGSYQKGMNLDDPYGEGSMKPPAKKKKGSRYCEWCAGKDHLTKRSQKCNAVAEAPKLYRIHDGSLLSGPPCTVADPDVQDDDPMVDPILDGAVHDDDDCEDFDHQPLVHMPGELGFDAVRFLAVDAEGDDDDVAIVGATI